MRRALIGFVMLAGWLTAVPAASAGVYTEFDAFSLPSLDKLPFWLQELRGVVIDPRKPAKPQTMKAAYQEIVATLEAKQARGDLSTLDRINLGGAYLRMGLFNEANEVLRQADQSHFLVLANRASASFGLGEFNQAVDYQRQALKAWPKVWAWWNTNQLKWYRRAEGYYLTFLELRAHESAQRADGRAVAITTVDRIFPKVRFVGPSGRYEAGALADNMRAALPDDALPLVTQLVLWQPLDLRLFWLLGEVLNALGQIKPAYMILDETVRARNGSGIPELMQHRRVLRDVKAAFDADPALMAQLVANITALGSRAMFIPAGIGTAGDVVLACAPSRLMELQQKAQQMGAIPPGGGVQTGGGAPPAGLAALPDWRQLAVGFAVGVAIAVLVGLQWREWRRRAGGVARGVPGSEVAEVPAGASPEGTADDGITRPTSG